MIWNIALAWHESMSDEPRADVEPLWAWWSVAPSASLRCGHQGAVLLGFGLHPKDYQRWRDLRAHLQQCEELVANSSAFARSAAYLAALEAQLLE